MSQRFYVVVDVDVPDPLTRSTCAHEQGAVAKLVSSLLRDALAARDIDVRVHGAFALTGEDPRAITLHDWALEVIQCANKKNLSGEL